MARLMLFMLGGAAVHLSSSPPGSFSLGSAATSFAGTAAGSFTGSFTDASSFAHKYRGSGPIFRALRLPAVTVSHSTGNGPIFPTYILKPKRLGDMVKV